MIKVYLTDKAIVYDNGKVIPWEVVFSAIEQLTDRKTVDKLRSKLKDKVKVNEVTVDSFNFGEIPRLLGVKEGNGMQTRIKAKIQSIDKKMREYDE